MRGVLVYERDDLMYALLREWLSGAGYSVLEPDGAADAAAQADLGIVSVAMPRETSDALIRWVRHAHPGMPIVALSGRARSGLSSDAGAARALGVEHVMAKPLMRRELLDAVASLIGPGRSRT